MRTTQVITVVCLLLWVNSFVDSGVLNDAQEAKKAYQDLILISAGISVAFVPIIIYTSDKYHMGWQLAAIFLIRACVFLCGWPFV